MDLVYLLLLMKGGFKQTSKDKPNPLLYFV